MSTLSVVGTSSQVGSSFVPKPPSQAPPSRIKSTDKCSNVSMASRTSGTTKMTGTTKQLTEATTQGAPRTKQALLKRVHSALQMQIGTLRKLFHDIDPQKDGFAPTVLLKKEICARMFLGDHEEPALDTILRMADPNHNGIIEFGRLTRLVRHQGDLDPSAPPTEEDEENDLRKRFATVNIGDKVLLNRLWAAEALEKMPTCQRTSNILGDTRVEVPWAVIGDNERMDHLLASIRKEKRVHLTEVLKKHATNNSGRLNRVQFITALREFDPQLPEPEVHSYYNEAAQGIRVRSVNIASFVERFGSNLLSSKPCRMSAQFNDALRWAPPPPLLVKAPVRFRSVRGTKATSLMKKKHMGASAADDFHVSSKRGDALSHMRAIDAMRQPQSARRR